MTLTIFSVTALQHSDLSRGKKLHVNGINEGWCPRRRLARILVTSNVNVIMVCVYPITKL